MLTTLPPTAPFPALTVLEVLLGLALADGVVKMRGLHDVAELTPHALLAALDPLAVVQGLPGRVQMVAVFKNDAVSFAGAGLPGKINVLTVQAQADVHAHDLASFGLAVNRIPTT